MIFVLIRPCRRSTAQRRPSPRGRSRRKIAIKMLGTNGGGYYNANAAHPFENPTPLRQLRPDALDLRDPERADVLPRPQGAQPGARLGGVGGDVRDVHGRRAGAVACRGRQQSALADMGVESVIGNMEGRKFASASSIPRCLRRSRPTPRVARSTACTTALRRSAGSCRCSICRPAK